MSKYKNNPYQILNAKVKRSGQLGSRNGYCLFKDEIFGILHFCEIIRNYIDYGFITPDKIIRTYLYARPGFNQSEFILQVCNKANLMSDCPLVSDDQFLRLCEAMSLPFGEYVSHARIFQILFDYKFRYPNFVGF